MTLNEHKYQAWLRQLAESDGPIDVDRAERVLRDAGRSWDEAEKDYYRQRADLIVERLERSLILGDST